MMRGAYSWAGQRRDYRTAPPRRALDEPFALAPPAPAAMPLADVADLVPDSVEVPRARRPVSIAPSEDGPTMTTAEVRARAVDFTAWRTRHRSLHRH